MPREEELYPIIKKYIDGRFDCNSVENKVVFNLLKNWKIDVVGARHTDSRRDVVAVEAGVVTA